MTTDLDGYAGNSLTPGADGGGTDAQSPEAATADSGPSPAGDAGAEAGGSAYADLILADKPVAYFPFDEPAGATKVTEKLSGISSDARSDDFTPGVPGIAGNALRATGGGGLDFGDTLDAPGQQPWTLEAWIKPEFEGDKVFYEYFNKRDETFNGMVAYVRRENNQVTVQVEQSYSGAGRGVNALLPSYDHFVHIVFVYDPDKTGLRVWVDGKVGDKGYDDPGGPKDNARNVYIASGIRGVIDEVAVYAYPLSDDRIKAHFAAGNQPPKL